MKIGIPKEVKIMEGRVGLIPEACAELVKYGHEVYVEQNAGRLSGYSDELFQQAGAHIVESAQELYSTVVLIVKVKEPVEHDLQYLTADHIVFSYLHLAANHALIQTLCDVGLTAIAFETVKDERGSLPLLTPMSEIAGRIAVQVGTHLLHTPLGGRGILLGGVTAAERGNVVVIGAGNAGRNSVLAAAGIGANITVFDTNHDKLAVIREIAPNITSRYAYQHAIEEAIQDADLVIGAVLIPAAHTPRIISEEMVKSMQQGSVIVDISVDQGGCVETIRPTSYNQPTYTLHGVTHFGVTNMPGAVPRTASQVLSAALIPYVLKIAEQFAQSGAKLSDDIRQGINVQTGEVIHPVLRHELGL